MMQEFLDQFSSPEWAPAALNAKVELAERLRTREQLAPLFHVGEVAPDAPENFIDEAEFERLVGDFSRIRMGQTDLRFDTSQLGDGEAAAYQQAAMSDIASILQTEGGRQLIRGLAYDDQDQTTTLKPMFRNGDPAQGRDLTNAKVWAGGRSMNEGEHRPDGSAGAGVSAEVLINPGHVMGPRSVKPTDDWMPIRPDVTLYHELMHAWDLVHGTMALGAVDASDGMHADDAGIRRHEYLAAGLGKYQVNGMSENAYRAARAEIAEGGVGVRPGDRRMEDRDTYVNHWE
jgi:Effector protein